ncbi:MAG: hypothetical protein ACE5FS_09700 [Paracoccaceae bacterium]
MRFFPAPLLLVLATCAGIQPAARSDNSFRFHKQRHCEGCEKNEADRRGMRGAANLPRRQEPGNRAAAVRRIA